MGVCLGMRDWVIRGNSPWRLTEVFERSASAVNW